HLSADDSADYLCESRSLPDTLSRNKTPVLERGGGFALRGRNGVAPRYVFIHRSVLGFDSGGGGLPSCLHEFKLMFLPGCRLSCFWIGFLSRFSRINITEESLFEGSYAN
ncbi:hypothetical protein, partial [Iodobacter violaceini]|uniref:hypothetical protein n=1 Tax=Iodobacter violaceini TaxID=3044271 RepID=UPI00197BF91D